MRQAAAAHHGLCERKIKINLVDIERASIIFLKNLERSHQGNKQSSNIRKLLICHRATIQLSQTINEMQY